jgi:flagellar hook-associated protein 2
MASLDGLVTGMSTSDMITQLMKIEAVPQTTLKTKISTATKVVTAYQNINTKMASVATAAKALNDPGTWTTMKATSSSDAAVVSAGPDGAAGTLTFRINQLAVAQQQTFTGSTVSSIHDADTAPVMSADTFDITLTDGSVATLTPANRSLQAVVSAINGEDKAPYKASAVLIGQGQYTLQLTLKESGTVAATTLSAFGGPSGLDLGVPVDTAAAVDADMTVTGPAGDFQVVSGSNNFTDVMPGVTITATKVTAVADPSVTVTLAPDGEGMAAKIQTLVDSANAALTEIAAQSKIKSGNVAAGALAGDSAMRKLSQDILSAIGSGAAGLGTNGTAGSFSEVGVSVDRYGKLTFDKEAFLGTYATDPDKTLRYFSDYTPNSGGVVNDKFDPGYDTAVGLARKLETVSLIATEGVVNPEFPTVPKVGILQGLIERRNDNIRGLTDQVSAWDVRLESRKAALQRQFSNLEVAMGKMQQQSSWLASQLASL